MGAFKSQGRNDSGSWAGSGILALDTRTGMTRMPHDSASSTSVLTGSPVISTRLTRASFVIVLHDGPITTSAATDLAIASRTIFREWFTQWNTVQIL